LPKTNIGILTATPGITKYINACTLFERTCDVLALPTMTQIHTIPMLGKEGEGTAAVHGSSAPPLLARTIMPEPKGEITTNDDDPNEAVQRDNTPVIFSIASNESTEEEDVLQPHPQLDKGQQELLYWHIRLSHLSFARLMWMAKWGLLPKCITCCKPPICSGCLFGRMTRKPWRTKAKPRTMPKQATQPGELSPSINWTQLHQV
jgi:hypothetical protein